MAYTQCIRGGSVRKRYFFQASGTLYMKGKGLVEVHKRVRKSVFPSVKRPSRANRSIYGCEKVNKYPDFMIL